MKRPDSTTFERLVREHHAAVFHSSVRVLRHPDDAEDVTQQVFLRVLEGKVDLDRAESPRKLLCWLSTQQSLNVLRGTRNRTDRERSVAMPSPEQTPSQSASSNETARTLRKSLDALPDEFRLPLVLRFQEGLSFASLGETLEISESTAHARVQRAIERLRVMMRKSGFAVAPVSLEKMLTESEALIVPATLESSLLALSKGAAVTAGVSSKVVVAVAALALGATTIGVAATWNGPWTGESDESAATTSVATGGSTTTASGLRPRTAADTGEDRTPVGDPSRDSRNSGSSVHVQDRAGPHETTLRGSVRDAAGFSVAGATVFARSTDSRKAPLFKASAITDEVGAFEIKLPVARGKTAQDYTLNIAKDGHTRFETDTITVRSDTANPPRDITMPKSAGDETSRFALAIRVVDANDRILEGVPVMLHNVKKTKVIPGQYGAQVTGKTDESGIATLRGDQLGEKILFVDGRKHGGVAVAQPIEIDTPIWREKTIRLTEGKTLSGKMHFTDGEGPSFWFVRLLDEDSGVYHFADVAADRTFRFDGLDGGTHTLFARGHGLSSVQLSGVRAQPDTLIVRFKREDDPRDVAMHMGEVHGRLRDAKTHEFLDNRTWDIEVIPVRDGESTLPFDLSRPRMAQQQLDAEEKARKTFHVTGLEPGRHGLMVRKRGFAPTIFVVTIQKNEIHRDVTIDLHRGGTIRGRILSGTGEPIPKAQVFVVGVGETADAILAAWSEDITKDDRRRTYPSFLAAQARTDAQGNFTLHRVPPDKALRVVAVHKDFRAAHSVPRTERDGAEGAPVELELTPR